MARKLSSAGYSVVWAVIAAVVIAAVGFAGWKVVQTNKTSDSTTNTTSPSAQTTPPSQPADPAEGDKYLVIKEWGVRFPLTDDLKGDVTYSLVTSASDSNQTAWFEVEKIANLPGSNCKLAPTEVAGNSGRSGGIGVYVTRKTQKASAEEERLTAFNLTYDGAWYYIGAPKGSCLTDQTQAQLEADTVQLLIGGLRGLKPVN